MNAPKRWVTLVWPLAQLSLAVNLGMALQRCDDGRASSLTLIVILMCVVGIAFLALAQMSLMRAATQNDHIGSRP